MPSVHRAITIDDLRTLARKRLPEFVFMPMETGSGKGEGNVRNRRSLEAKLLAPPVLVDIAGLSQEVTVFGKKYASPFGISAVGNAANFRWDADRLLAEAARAAAIPFMLSGSSSAALETIVPAAPGLVWSQLYAARDKALTDHMIGRAAGLGVEVLVLTVDVPARPRNDYLARAGISLPANIEPHALPHAIWQALTHPAWTLEFLRHGGARKMASWAPYAPAGAGAAAINKVFGSQVPSNLVWSEVERIRRLWPGKLVLKGIVAGADALRAIEAGADAITVSNHGGNRLACMAGAIDTLPLVKAAVGDRIPLFFDGGILRGVDLLVAHCLGADFCFVGRATLYGVAAGGSAGARRAIDILREELGHAMTMGGIPSLAQAGPHLLHPDAGARPPG